MPGAGSSGMQGPCVLRGELEEVRSTTEGSSDRCVLRRFRAGTDRSWAELVTELRASEGPSMSQNTARGVPRGSLRGPSRQSPAPRTWAGDLAQQSVRRQSGIGREPVKPIWVTWKEPWGGIWGRSLCEGGAISPGSGTWTSPLPGGTCGQPQGINASPSRQPPLTLFGWESWAALKSA